MAESPPSAESGTVTLHLLDSAQGHPVQSWRFHNKTLISIGRLPESDIAIVDPQVSRLHVELRYANGYWTLYSLGRNGTIVNGQTLKQCMISDRWILQLGNGGPTFRFHTAQDSLGHNATINNMEGNLLDLLVIDQKKKEQEVEQLIDGETMRVLKERVRQLKEGNKQEGK